MRFTASIAAAILTFPCVVPTFAVPLTARNVNQTNVVQDVALNPVTVSAAPNGIMVPDFIVRPADTTNIVSPFKIPGNVEGFPHIQNASPPTETTKTGLPFDSHPDNLENFPHIEATSTGAHHRYKNRPTRRPLIDEVMVDTHVTNKKLKLGERPRRYGNGPPNFHPWGMGGHGPVIPPKHPNHGQHKPTPTDPRRQEVHHFEHKPTNLPKIPPFPKEGHGPVFNPGLSSRPISAPTATVTYSNLTGGPIFDHTRRPNGSVNASVLPFGRSHATGAPIDTSGTIASRGLKTEDSTASGSETFAEQTPEPYSDIGAYYSCMEQPVVIGDFTWYNYELMNAVAKEVISHTENPAHGNETDATKELQATLRLERERTNVLFLEVAGLKRHRICLAKHLPSFQISTIAPRRLNGSDYDEADKAWTEIQIAKQTYAIELAMIWNAELRRVIDDFLKADLLNSTTDGTSPFAQLNLRCSHAKDGIWQNIASSITATAVNAPAYVAEKVGDEVLSEHEPEIESWANKIFHHSKKPHTKPPTIAPYSNSTSAHVKEVATDSDVLSRRQLIFPDMETAQVSDMAMAYKYLVSERRGGELTPKLRCDIYNYLFKFNTTNTDGPEVREVARRLGENASISQ